MKPCLIFFLPAIVLICFTYCKKTTSSATFTGAWKTSNTKTFDDLILWTSFGKITDQNIIRSYLQRNPSEYFSLNKTPETLDGSATFRFEDNYAITRIDGKTDTVEYLEKNNQFTILRYEVNAFITLPTNTCERLIDSVLFYPSTTTCQQLPPVGGFPGGYKCTLPQYYPIEINGDQLQLAVFSYQIRSVFKNDLGQTSFECSTAASNIANIISPNLNEMLKANDTIVTQKVFIRLNKL
jgi:hypothetical protein